MDRGFASDGKQGLHAMKQKTVIHTDATGRNLKFNKTQNFLDHLQQSRSDGEDEKYRRVRECNKIDKLKSKHFYASIVKIGRWEKLAINENDIMAKFYFNQKRFVWEILHDDRKFKMVISWHHISAIRAVFNGETSSLFIELEKPPAFFIEGDIVPRGQTRWDVIGDFTHGEGLKHRWHVLTFNYGNLEKKQYERIIYSKGMLYLKSRAPFPSNNSPFFDNVPNNIDGFLSYDSQSNPQCLPDQTYINFASHDRQQALMAHPVNQIPQDNANLSHSSTVTNMDSSVQAMQSYAPMSTMPANSARNFQPNYTSAEMNSSFDGNVPLPILKQIEEQPIGAHSTPAPNLYSQRVNVGSQTQFYGNGSFLDEMDQVFQPQEGFYSVDVGEYTSHGVQNSLVANGVYNQTEEAHGLTSWGNRENTIDDDEHRVFHYLCDNLNPPIGDQIYPMDFTRANDYGPNRQFLDPSVDMQRTRNEHQENMHKLDWNHIEDDGTLRDIY